MNDDATLLRLYAEQRDETAFREVVNRHSDLVYAAALRRTGGNCSIAAEVAQDVFIAFARHARALSAHPALVAWLHTATRNAALKRMISDRRRLERETTAHTLVSATDASPDWEQIRPHLDAAIDELPETDRAAIILRFLQQRPFAAVGVALRISEDAARMRTDRAIDRLRAVLARRGISSTAAALGTVVASQPLVSAPAGLAGQFASHALASAGATTVTPSLFAAMNIKILLAATASAVAGFFVGARVGHSSTPLIDRTELARQEQSLTALRNDNQRLAADLMRANAALTQARSQPAAPVATEAATASTQPRRSLVLGLQSWEIQENTLTNLRQIDAARKQHLLEKRQLAGSIQELVGRKSYIKTVRPVDGEDYTGLSMDPTLPLTVTTAGGMLVTFDPAGATTTKPDYPPEVLRVKELNDRVQHHIGAALSAYRQANGGKNPPTEQALVPYFPSAKDGADFVELLEAKKAAGL